LVAISGGVRSAVSGRAHIYSK